MRRPSLFCYKPVAIRALLIDNLYMYLDIIIVVILLICALRGKANGFLDSLIRLSIIALGITVGVLNTERLRSLLFVLPIDDIMKLKLTKRFHGQNMDLTEFIPKGLRVKFEDFGLDTLNTTVNHFTNLSMTIISFSLIVGTIWGVISLIRHKRLKTGKHKTLFGTVDSSVGLLLGAIKGAIIIFLGLALMLPVAGLFAPAYINMINEQLNNSYIAGYLYDINPLIYFMHKLYM